MTRPSRSSLVLDGSEVKYRLEAERLASKTPVHVDWVRFTVLRRNAPFVPVDLLFPHPDTNIWDENYRAAQQARVLRDIPDCDFDAATQALDLAQTVVTALGPDFAVNPEFKKGHDFYKFRWCIERNGAECGWVGFLSSGDSPRQKAQAQTIHCNLFGMACTFASHGWRNRLADILETRDATLTRCDLALDFFDGYPGGIKAIRDDYNEGRCNVGGKLLKVNFVGDWSEHSQGGRSIYFGSKEAGKETNAYEKGDQLFGVDAGSPWLRLELRYGNKLRVLPVDMLRRPADFFAGASDWHAVALALADAVVEPQKVSTIERLPLETIEAECVRNIRWTLQTAAPSVAAAFQYLGVEEFLTFVSNQKLPGRLQKFMPAELGRSFTAAFGRLSQPEGAPAFIAA